MNARVRTLPVEMLNLRVIESMGHGKSGNGERGRCFIPNERTNEAALHPTT